MNPVIGLQFGRIAAANLIGPMSNQRPARIRPPPTAETLGSAALHYLARYAASEAALRRVLHTKIQRAIRLHPDFAADRDRQQQLADAIEAIIVRHRKSGILNDATYAEMKVRGMRQRGRSRRLIAQTLSGQGINGDVVKEALVAFDDDRSPDAAEVEAADALARRRKLGPYRTTPVTDTETARKANQKDFATLARAGFSIPIIKRVLGRQAIDMDDGSDPGITGD